MEYGSSKGWGAALMTALVSGLFALILISLLLYCVWKLLQRLLAAVDVVHMPARASKGSAGLLRDCRNGLGHLLWISVLSATSLAILLPSLTYFFPAFGTAHRWITTIIKTDRDQAQVVLTRGLQQGDAALLELALAMGANPNGDSRTGQGDSLTRTRDPALREMLLKYGASPDGDTNGTPLLVRAAWDRDLDEWRWLLQHGARIGLGATRRQPASVLHALATEKVDVTWLHAALEVGVDPNIKDAGGASLLDVVVLSDTGPDWLDALREAGAKHLLPLEAPELPTDHPAVAVAQNWMQTDHTKRVWANGWAAQGLRAADILRLTAQTEFAVRGDLVQVLVQVQRVRRYDGNSGIDGNAVLRLVPRHTEAAGVAGAEAPAVDGQDVIWLVAGAWPDQRRPATAAARLN